eukprot:Hpha_TRINITY_DN16114_c4_g3::TRINITY_DN16114_c4_g3_i1::g.5601::m.5601
MAALILAACAAAGSSVLFPRVRVTAPDTVEGWRAIGLAVGKNSSARVAANYAADLTLLQLVDFVNSDPRGASLLEAMNEFHNVTYPHGFAYMEGVAEGTGQPFMKIALQNYRQEMNEARNVAWGTAHKTA